MTNPNSLYEDMEKLDKLYEQLGWNHTDPLTFMIEGDKIVIKNLYENQRRSNITVCDRPDNL
jgi:bifunctional DNA-binding transcriptional regulator/antitoxin component of YhaV-PrlF toxin-antitoxin module